MPGAELNSRSFGIEACSREVSEARLKAGGSRARAERTMNIFSIVVTLDVSQLEMSASKCLKPEKSAFISEMRETSQWAIGPYAPIAEVASTLVL